jgi:hypothetical protein
VVPLEVQLETILTRGYTFSGESLESRAVEMVRVLREKGCDRSLLEWAMRDEHIAKFEQMMDGS